MTISAHRAAWQTAYGKIADGMHVLHRCDNPSCVNPEHLFLGSNKDNVSDRVAKGRQQRGSRAGKAKLTEEMVIKLRSMKGPGVNMCAVARAIGMTKTALYHALNGRTWKHIPGAVRYKHGPYRR